MEQVFVGIDIGSISAKMVALDKDGRIIFHEYRRTLGRPVETAIELFEQLKQLGLESIATVATGSGAKLLSQTTGDRLTIQNEFKAIVKAINTSCPGVRTIFEMGGESSKFILLSEGPDPLIVEYGVNGDCAAGTGSFIDQQATRLHYNVEDIGDIVSKAGRCARVAGRCSVFAKSDMIHAQQKGYTPPEVLKGLCLAVARNFKATIVKGRHVIPKAAFIGGLALNGGMVTALCDTFGLKDGEIIVPKEAAYLGALGAAMLARQDMSRSFEHSNFGFVSNFDIRDSNFNPSQHLGNYLPSLSTENVRFLRDQTKPYHFHNGGKIDVYIGIDIGSVSTNFVVIDEVGDLIMEIYTYTKARPIEVVANGLKEIESAMGDRINVIGVGTTGSGRELIGELIGADVIKDEITAHKTGAVHICGKLVGETVDTIFEIGGQDAKFIRIENGIVTDFTMNEACAAGTGSFLEEQAEKLGIKIKEEFAKLALSSDAPIPLGERCTVFMERDVNACQLKGSKIEDIVAGLAYSVATNYLNRVVRGRKIGDHIFFQGGTAYNDAVAAAFSKILGKKITVPPHNGVIGAVGVALLAKEKADNTRFRGFDIGRVNYTMREFSCNACSNICDIQEFKVEGEKTYWGDKCSSRFRKKAHTNNKPVIEDLFKVRQEMLLGLPRSAQYAVRTTKIGIPRAMFFYDRFPFWKTYFNALGCDVIISDETNKIITHDSIELTIAEPCFPIKLVHGHVKNLIDKGVDYIFLPNVISSDRSTNPEMRNIIPYLCPWHQTIPFVVRPVGAFSQVKFLSPTIQFEYGPDFVAGKLHCMARGLGASKKENKEAIKKAYLAQSVFNRRLQELGSQALKTLDKAGAVGIVLIGRPYNIYDMGANLNAPQKLREYYGINVIPLDFLPLDKVNIGEISNNMFWSHGRKLIAASKIVTPHPNLHMIYITNFKCGPDSFIKHLTTWCTDNVARNSKPYLTLQFDEHANDAGTLTRIEAYLDSKGLLRANNKEQKTNNNERIEESHTVHPRDGLWRGKGAGCGV